LREICAWRARGFLLFVIMCATARILICFSRRFAQLMSGSVATSRTSRATAGSQRHDDEFEYSDESCGSDDYSCCDDDAVASEFVDGGLSLLSLPAGDADAVADAKGERNEDDDDSGHDNNDHTDDDAFDSASDEEGTKTAGDGAKRKKRKKHLSSKPRRRAPAQLGGTATRIHFTDFENAMIADAYKQCSGRADAVRLGELMSQCNAYREREGIEVLVTEVNLRNKFVSMKTRMRQLQPPEKPPAIDIDAAASLLRAVVERGVDAICEAGLGLLARVASSEELKPLARALCCGSAR